MVVMSVPRHRRGLGRIGVDDDPDPLGALHREHYAALVRLATLVLGDVGLAEQEQSVRLIRPAR